jgi:hypothetical protein
MFRHVLVLKWDEGVTAEQGEEAAAALRALPEEIPELLEMRVGTDLGLRDTAWDLGFMATFEDEAGWRAYLDHPAHVKVSHDILTPIIAERASVQMLDD